MWSVCVLHMRGKRHESFDHDLDFFCAGMMWLVVVKPREIVCPMQFAICSFNYYFIWQREAVHFVNDWSSLITGWWFSIPLWVLVMNILLHFKYIIIINCILKCESEAWYQQWYTVGYSFVKLIRIIVIVMENTRIDKACVLTLWLPGRGACQDPDILV